MPRSLAYSFTAERPEIPAAQKPDNGPITLLLAAASRTIRMGIAADFRSAFGTCEVLEARTARELFDHLDQHVPMVAFVDLDMLGPAALPALAKSTTRDRATIFIGIADHLSEAAVPTLRSLNFLDVLLRPLKSAQVATTIIALSRALVPISTLVIDPNRTVLNVIRKVLDQSLFNFAAEYTSSPDEALKRLSEAPFELAIVDHLVTTSDGSPLFTGIHQTSASTRLVLSSSSQLPKRLQDRDPPQADTFLKKPFFPNDIDGVVCHFLGVPVLRLAAPEESRGSDTVLL